MKMKNPAGMPGVVAAAINNRDIYAHPTALAATAAGPGERTIDFYAGRS